MQLEQTQSDFEAGLKRLSDPATSSMLQSDAELLELYLYGGRQDAMVLLVQRFAPLVTSVIRRVVSHPQDAEDAFQATFLILLKSAKNIRSRPSIAAWLYGVAYRTACRVRTKSRRQAQSLGEADMPAAESDQNPIVLLARQIELGNLDRELERLPENLREPLTEHYIFGYSARQIADRMELSVSAVEGRLRRGRRLLRHRLALRGTSLSVVVTGAAWFRDHQSTATASDAWTDHLLQSPIFDPDASAGVPLACDPYLAELVKGESTMHMMPFLKSASFLTAAAIATVSMSVIAVAMQLGPAPKVVGGAAAATQVERAEADSDEQTAERTIDTRRSNADKRNASNTAQSAAAPGASQVNGAAANANVDPFGPAASDVAAADALGGATNVDPFATGNSNVVNTFVRPSGNTPNWLRAGEEDLSASEMIRDTLRQTVEVDFTGLPLRQVMDTLESKSGVSMVINEKEFSNANIDPDVPVTVSVNELPLCEALELILEPLGLRYEVQPHYIKIVESGNVSGAIRYYDLAYVLPTSAGVRDLVNAIELTISDEGWAPAGGTSSISAVGSMMVVNCSEKAHRQIEKMLAELAKVDPQNLRSSGFSNRVFLGGGMGGMGGGGMGSGGMGGSGGMF